jgi:hypothetical protein
MPLPRGYGLPRGASGLLKRTKIISLYALANGVFFRLFLMRTDVSNSDVN